MASICFIKALEYRHIKKRWRRLNADNSSTASGSAQLDAEMDRLAVVTAAAHLPESDASSTYYSAMDLDLDSADK